MAYNDYARHSDVDALKRGWLTQESRSLEQLYGLSSNEDDTFTRKARQIPALRKHLDLLGVKSLGDPSMDEEQEREVSHEVETERQVQRPPKLDPVTHVLHKSIRFFANMGCFPGGTPSGIVPLLSSLEGLEGGRSSPSVFASTDFMTTVRGASIKGGLHDYLRPVHWILSSHAKDHTILVVLSPFEANELLPTVMRSSIVRLHIYNARVTESMRSMSNLEYHYIPAVPTAGWTPLTLEVQCQLNLWAGQLYLDNYDSYLEMCKFLGIKIHESSNPGEGKARR